MSTTIPTIRFKGFTDAWEQRKFESFVNRISKNSENPFLPRVEYEYIKNGQGELNEKFKDNQNLKSGIEFNKGDVLFGKLRPYLQNWLLAEFDGVAVGDWWVFRPLKTDSVFLYFFIQGKKYQEVSNISVGTKMPRSDWNIVSSVSFLISPNFQEQQKIGSFFKTLDTLITLHQRKCDKLEAFKKSCLQNMFPGKGETVPKIRLRGFSGEWKNKKAGLLFKEIVQKNFPNLPVLSASQEFGMIRRDDIGINLSYDKNNLKNYKRIREGQFAIHLASFQSGFAHSPIDGVTSPAYTVLDFKEKDEHCDLFWKRVLTSNAFVSNLKQITYGIRVGKSIDYNEFLGLSFCYPRLEEQQKIAEFFMSIDEKIRLEKLKYDKLKDLKRFCLQKMFA